MAAPRSAQGKGGAFALEISAFAGRGHVAYLRRLLRAARALVRGPLASMHVILVGNARMAALHQQFMGVPGPTDVLTFPLDEDAKGRATEGEVYVCVPYAAREARRRGIRMRDELLLYAVHGMLHLCGYDDRTDRDYATMHRKEDDILRAIGVGAVFAREREGSGFGVQGSAMQTRASLAPARRAGGSSPTGKSPRAGSRTQSRGGR